MDSELQKSLQKICVRVNFDRVERKLYGHDVGALPSLVKPLIGNTIPDAVVQPQSENELVELVRWANQNKIALTPRAKATSGYGGVLPIKQGVEVDFYFLKSVLHLDRESQTVTVEPGITWEQLDRTLQSHGMTLRLYPSSYPSSTVGGWLAQGGAGFGSYQYGYFSQNVVSTRVVQPDGEIKIFKDGELDMISEMEGITGFISQVTLRIQPFEKLDIVSIGCKQPQDFQRLIQSKRTSRCSFP